MMRMIKTENVKDHKIPNINNENSTNKSDKYQISVENDKKLNNEWTENWNIWNDKKKKNIKL